jgi:hypothetical protein
MPITYRKDAIIASFDVDPRAFRPETKVTPNQIQIQILRNRTPSTRSASRDLLGFIRFNKKAGSVELANFKAKLALDHLYVGTTTKRDRGEFAGMHGEGFKLGALVMQRNCHSVRFVASGFYWNFGLKGLRGSNRSTLQCRLSLPKPGLVEKERAKYATMSAKPNFRRRLRSNIWEDVSVKIAKARKGGKKISEEDFKSWLKVAIDLDPPSSTDTIQTAHGDLILDKRFARHIYLKGLLLTDHDPKHHFGYNFIRGRINRDRDGLVNQSEEIDMLAKIWEHAILENDPKIIDIYIELFRDHEECAEISASDKISLSAVEAIWKQLKISSSEAFFYPENDASSTVDHQVEYSLPTGLILYANIHIKDNRDHKRAQEKAL